MSNISYRMQVLIGVVLGGLIGPAMGIAANMNHQVGMIIAAVAFSLTGTALLLHAVLRRKPRGN